MLTHLVRGLTILGNGPAIGFLVAGSLIGMFLGVIPGLGGAVVLTVVLAFVYHISTTGTLCLFLATQAGSYFSASITSILLNTPAHPEAFAVTFDGFPMAQRGEAGRALGISAASTCIGGLIGCAVLVGFIQIMNFLNVAFHPPEYVALITIALLLVGTLGTDQVSKALISMGAALMISSIGPSPITGIYRYTFGAVGLLSGISIVAVFLGMFAIPQMVLVFGTASTIARQNMMGEEVDAAKPVELEKGFAKQVVGGVVETLHHRWALLRSALVGVVTGVIPGIGGFAANFISYGIAQQSSRQPERYGTGIPEGIIAPEGSSLSKEAGGMVPLLGLGIPGGVGAALFLAALTIKGIKVGYGFTAAYPDIAYETVWIIALGGLIGTIAGVLTAPFLARVTRVPGPALVPLIMGISVIGTFVSDVSFFSVMEVVVFAVVGFVLRRLRYSLAAVGVGLVLGPTLESSIYETHEVYPGWTFMLKRPVADVLFAVALALLIVKWFQFRRAAKSAAASAAQDDGTTRGAIADRERDRPYPLLAVITTAIMLALAAAFVTYGVVHYSSVTVTMPLLGGGLVGLAALWRLPLEIAGYVRYRHLRGRAFGESSQVAAEEPQLATADQLQLAAPGAPRLSRLGGGEEPSDVDLLLSGELSEISSSIHEAPSDGGADNGGLPPVKDKAWGVNGQYSREVVGFLWFGVLVAACYVFGFYDGSALFCVLYGLTATRRLFRSWTRRAIFAVLTAAVIWIAAYEIQTVLHVSFVPLIKL